MKSHFKNSIIAGRSTNNGESLLVLSPTARVVLRDSQHLQFGVDPSHAAILETPHALQLAQIFQHAITPKSRTELLAALQKCGVVFDQAWSILTDLVEYRVLVPHPRSTFVTILGRGLLRDTLSDLFAEARLLARGPYLGQTLSSYFSENSPHITILANRRLSKIPEVSCLVENCPSIIPIELMDGRAIIGPLRLNRRGACPLCLDLHRADCDPSWVRVMNSLPPELSPEPIVTTAAAAVGSAITQKALGRIIDPPGNHDSELVPGSVFLIDPLHFSIEHYLMRKHPRCPVCFWESSQPLSPPENPSPYRNWVSVSNTASPNRSIFTGPTPGIVSNSSRLEGMDSAMATSVASENTM